MAKPILKLNSEFILNITVWESQPAKAEALTDFLHQMKKSHSMGRWKGDYIFNIPCYSFMEAAVIEDFVKNS